MKQRHETRSKRKRRQRWLKAFIWVFICVFAVSVVGGLMVYVIGSGTAGQ